MSSYVVSFQACYLYVGDFNLAQESSSEGVVVRKLATFLKGHLVTDSGSVCGQT